MEATMKRAWVAAAMVAGLLFVGAHTVSAGQSHTAPVLTYQVHAGETLWSIAEHVAPSKDQRDVVYQIIAANHLGSPTIVPGQTLHIPSQ
jgi:LysM repeat protein